MISSSWPSILTSLLIYLVFAAIVLCALHWVIRSALQNASAATNSGSKHATATTAADQPARLETTPQTSHTIESKRTAHGSPKQANDLQWLELQHDP